MLVKDGTEMKLVTDSRDHLNTISQIEKTAEVTEASGGLQLRTVNAVFLCTAFLLVLALFLVARQVNSGYERNQAAIDRGFQAENAADMMSAASDYLTDHVHCFVVTEDRMYLDGFLTEVQETKRREQAVASLEELLGDNGNRAYACLLRAQELSNQLVDEEYTAMRLILEANDVPEDTVPEALLSAAKDAELQGLTAQEKRERAVEMVFGDRYMSVKREIRANIDECLLVLNTQTRGELDAAGAQMRRLLLYQSLLTIAMVAAVAVMAVYISVLVRKPLTRMVRLMKDKQPLPCAGAAELRFVARTYNEIVEENQKTTERLAYEAMHDGLTGLYNRYAYELLCRDTDLEHAAMLIVDVDNFKGINDTWGHVMGDRILCRVAEVLRHSFRSVDQIYRYGGDEFVVVMTRANSSLRDLVLDKINRANEILKQPEDGMPPVSLSVGVAFCDRENPEGTLIKDADTALYRVKQAGRGGCAIY